MVLVGHSYGGAVITEAGTDPKVARAGVHRRLRPGHGRVGVHADREIRHPARRCRRSCRRRTAISCSTRAKFPASFAGDVDTEQAAFMADSQVPWGVGALGGTISEPAWKTKPSWYLVATEDQMIPPDAQRRMSQARGRDGRRGQGQPRHLRVAAPSGGIAHRDGRPRRVGRGTRELGVGVGVGAGARAPVALRPRGPGA